MKLILDIEADAKKEELQWIREQISPDYTEGRRPAALRAYEALYLFVPGAVRGDRQ